MKDKSLKPLGTMIKKKALLGEDLHVGDVVVSMPSARGHGWPGIAVVAGETPSSTRLIYVDPDVVLGTVQLPAPVPPGQRLGWGAGLRITLHKNGGSMFKLHDPGLAQAPWCAYVHKYIEDRT